MVVRVLDQLSILDPIAILICSAEYDYVILAVKVMKDNGEVGSRRGSSFLVLYLLSMAFFFMTANRAFPIVYGNVDCDSNGQNCAHPNVGFISAFDSAGNTITGTRCSSILISVDDVKYVFLTAAHCAEPWLVNTSIATIGITFDGMVIRPDPDDPAFNYNQFVLGGVPVQFPGYFHNVLSANDWACIVFPLNSTDPFGFTISQKWPGRVPAPLIQDSSIASLDALAASFRNPTRSLLFTAAGYGFTEFVDFPGDNRGGLNSVLLSLGTLRYASHQLFRNLRNSILKTSQNPALGNDGTCSGDSGGPNYYNLNGTEIVVGVTSSGDSVCRSTNEIARIDVPEAESFIDCVRALNKSINQVKACGRSTNRFD